MALGNKVTGGTVAMDCIGSHSKLGCMALIPRPVSVNSVPLLESAMTLPRRGTAACVLHRGASAGWQAV